MAPRVAHVEVFIGGLNLRRMPPQQVYTTDMPPEESLQLLASDVFAVSAPSVCLVEPFDLLAMSSTPTCVTPLAASHPPPMPPTPRPPMAPTSSLPKPPTPALMPTPKPAEMPVVPTVAKSASQKPRVRSRGALELQDLAEDTELAYAIADAEALVNAQPSAMYMLLHGAACARGYNQYVDPSTGYKVWTSHFLGKRSCCGNKCRHCPWQHKNVPKSKHGT
eukprot:CAMPEP_0183355016 /NCGR_PEP_ID=MMETSP0164_2-20130417/38873_1 /TAXON_ID=221442 /ORGANISM="Coccolithus pelagicus ssp braarudi, Strain PLY182g" /LENGTH=220 /DNA_ID=CAMNT_0025528013 /DNA_START=338 /DNA_END=1000 /DNA_ORIENTATION=+